MLVNLSAARRNLRCGAGLPAAAWRTCSRTSWPTAAGDRIRLRDGRCVALRPLETSSASRFQQFIRDLSPVARSNRFHAGFREAPAPLLQALTAADQAGHVAWVAEDCAGHGPIVAEARYVMADGEAELALAVADRWRHQGMGRHLLCRLLRHAATAGARRIKGFIRGDNQPMLRLALDAGFELHPAADDPSVVVAERNLSPATPAASLPALPGGSARPTALARRVAASVVRWIGDYGVAIAAAVLLPGGLLLVLGLGVRRRLQRRAGRRPAAQTAS